jgi:cysteine-rich repeat protein
LDVFSSDGPLGSTCASLNVDTNVTIYDSLGNTLGVNDDNSASDYCSTLSVPGLPPGTYYIEVTSSPFAPTATFDYSLQATVTSTSCGDGVLDAGEACDDGNTINKDGCSTLCALEPGFTCAGTPTVCVDKNECMLGTANCAALATCVNTPGSFNCVCPANLDGDGKQNGVGCTTGIYYAFDGSGTAVPNLATTPPLNNAANATIVGGQTQGNVGKCGTALVGIGGLSSANYVNTAWPTLLNGSWTISFWINNYTSAVSNDYFFGDSTAQSFRCFAGGFAGATNVILRGTGMTDVIVNGAANGTLAMTTFVYDATANNIKAYLNGALVNTVAQAAPLSFVGAGPLKVGGYASSNALPANARLDEFRLYFRPFTAAQVAALYNSASCTP